MYYYYLRTQEVPEISMTTGFPTGEGAAVTVTRIEELSSPFSFCASTLKERSSVKIIIQK